MHSVDMDTGVVARKRGFSALVVVMSGVLGVVLALVLAAGLLRMAAKEVGEAGPAALLSHLFAALAGRSTTIDGSAPAVVDRIRKLSRLESVVYSLDKVVSGSRENSLIPDFLVGDKLLMIAHGEVIAGVDMGQLKASDVVVKGDSVRLRLPDPQVLTTRVDNGKTRVYSRSTGLLVSADPDLESKVREAAEEQMTQAAVADGILDKARVNARASVSGLLYGLGFHTVVVE